MTPHKNSPARKSSNTAVIVTTVIGVIALLALGTWQVYRLQWKQQLIESRQAALTGNPVTMADIGAGIEHGYDVDFLKVRMTGEYRHDQVRYVYRPRGKRAGVQVITPFIDKTGFIVLVDRGFIDEGRLGGTDNLRLPQGEITITGITRVRAGDRNLFSPGPDLARKIWYWYDLPDIANSLAPDIAGDAAQELPPIMASVFVQLPLGSEPGKAAAPEPEDLKVELPNNHLQYALTWYSLALVLIVISWLFIRRRHRDAMGQAGPEQA